MKKENLQWHPAFVAALRITFQDEIEELQILQGFFLCCSGSCHTYMNYLSRSNGYFHCRKKDEGWM